MLTHPGGDDDSSQRTDVRGFTGPWKGIIRALVAADITVSAIPWQAARPTRKGTMRRWVL
jgi:hypothetical protein